MKNKPVIQYASLIRRCDSTGVQWGEVFVLCRRGSKELWRIMGSTVRYSRLYSEWSAGEVVLVSDANEHWNRYIPEFTRVLSRNSRVSKKLMRENAEAINKFFGCDVASMITSKKTVLILE